MTVNIPPQSTPPQDEKSRLFNRAWYLTMDSFQQAINSLLSANGEDDGLVYMNGVKVTY